MCSLMVFPAVCLFVPGSALGVDSGSFESLSPILPVLSSASIRSVGMSCLVVVFAL